MANGHWTDQQGLVLRRMAYQGFMPREIADELRRSPRAVVERARTLRIRVRTGRAGSPETADWLRHQIQLLSRRTAALQADALEARSRVAVAALNERHREVLERFEHLREFVQRLKKRIGRALLPMQTHLVTIGKRLKMAENKLAQKSGRGWLISRKAVKKGIDVILFILRLIVNVSDALGQPIAPAVIKWLFELKGVVLPGQ